MIPDDWRKAAMMGIKGARGQTGKRVFEKARCCGVLYSRWKPIGGKFPGTHARICCVCGKLLTFRKTTKKVGVK